jgi:signal transduction histidine kinase
MQRLNHWVNDTHNLLDELLHTVVELEEACGAVIHVFGREPHLLLAHGTVAKNLDPAGPEWQTLDDKFARLVPLTASDNQKIGVLACFFKQRPELSDPVLKASSVLVGLIGRSVLAGDCGWAQAPQQAVLEERSRLARDLHDTAAQSLLAVKLQLEIAQEVWKPHLDQARTRVGRALELLEQSENELRDTIRSLRDPSLEAFGLEGALARLADDHHEPPTRFQSAGRVAPLSPTIESDLFRTALEAVNNAVRHSHASQIELRLDYLPRMVRLTVHDDGRGFELNGVPSTGYGLIGMHERASRIGADLTVRSQPGLGTEICLSLQLER